MGYNSPNSSSHNPPIGSSSSGNNRAQGSMPARDESRAQQWNILNGPVAILWDIENCPVPNEVNAEDVAANVRMALSLHPAVRGAVTMFSAYGDFNHFPRKVREGCHRTGINLIDVPNGKKDASDKAILVDMFLFALDNPPPCTILLISGDVDFAPALHKLGQRGYTVVLAIPAGFVSGTLCSAGRYVWDWVSVARGQGLVPAKTFQSRGDSSDANFRYPGTMMVPSDESGDESFRVFGGQNVGSAQQQYRVQSSGDWSVSMGGPLPNGGYLHQDGPRLSPQSSQNFGVELRQGQWSQMNSVSVSAMPASQELQNPPTMASNLKPVNTSTASTSTAAAETTEANADPTSPGAQSQTSFVQPGDISGLKRQLVKLLSLHGGKMALLRVPPEYCKMYGRPLYLAEYGSLKLVHLIEKMRDTLSIRGEGVGRTVHFTKIGARVASKYKKVWGSACKANEKDVLEEAGASTSNKKEQQESREGPKEESKNVVDEELVVYVSKMDLSQESDSASPDEQVSDHPEEEADEVVEIQEVTETAEEFALEMRREVFRQELQDLLVSFACHILVSDFLELYQQRYAKDPDYAAYGVQDLESLLDKVKDIAVLREDAGSGKKFLVANLGFLPHIGFAQI